MHDSSHRPMAASAPASAPARVRAWVPWLARALTPALLLACVSATAQAQTIEPVRPLLLQKPRAEGELMRARDLVKGQPARTECPLWGDSRGLFAAPSGGGWSLDLGPGYFHRAEVVNPPSLGAGTLLRCHYRRNMQSIANARTGVSDEVVYVQQRNLGPGTDAARCKVTERVVECQP
jgi:hypothetical protein